MHLTFVLSTFVFILFIYWLIKRFLDRHDVYNIPPGPYGLPIVGYLPFLGQQPHKVLSQLGKKYGNVFSIQMGAHLGVVLNDWKAIKSALIDQSDIFSGRPILDIINDVGGRFGKFMSLCLLFLLFGREPHSNEVHFMIPTPP